MISDTVLYNVFAILCDIVTVLQHPVTVLCDIFVVLRVAATMLYAAVRGPYARLPSNPESEASKTLLYLGEDAV